VWWHPHSAWEAAAEPVRRPRGRPRRRDAPADGAYDLLDLDMCEVLQHGRQVAGERCPTDRGSSITGLAFTPPGSPYPGE
jgi:hypothetical protein